MKLIVCGKRDGCETGTKTLPSRELLGPSSTLLACFNVVPYAGTVVGESEECTSMTLTATAAQLGFEMRSHLLQATLKYTELQLETSLKWGLKHSFNSGFNTTSRKMLRSLVTKETSEPVPWTCPSGTISLRTIQARLGSITSRFLQSTGPSWGGAEHDHWNRLWICTFSHFRAPVRFWVRWI